MNVGSNGGDVCCSLSPAFLRMWVFLGNCSYIINPEGISLVLHLSDLLQNGDHRDYLNDLTFKLQHKTGKEKVKSHEYTP